MRVVFNYSVLFYPQVIHRVIHRLIVESAVIVVAYNRADGYAGVYNWGYAGVYNWGTTQKRKVSFKLCCLIFAIKRCPVGQIGKETQMLIKIAPKIIVFPPFY